MWFERSIVIERPPSNVVDYVADVRNDPKWHTDVLEARMVEEGPVGAGTTFEVKFKPMMGVSEGTMTVSDYEPGKRAVLKGRVGKMTPTISYMVEPEASGARITRRVEMQPPGIMRVMAALMKGVMGKQNAKFLANLKRELEGS
jgi:carbon monoxide dehydrogenase subunit G